MKFIAVVLAFAALAVAVPTFGGNDYEHSNSQKDDVSLTAVEIKWQRS